MPSLTADQLRAGMETLPQEMYDEIFNLTFAYDHDQKLIIDDTYRPPFQLQINTEIRKKFGCQFYGSARPLLVRATGRNAYVPATSSAVPSSVRDSMAELLRCWLLSLPEDALAAVRYGMSVGWDAGSLYDGRIHFCAGWNGLRAGWNAGKPYIARYKVHSESKMGLGHYVLAVNKIFEATGRNLV